MRRPEGVVDIDVAAVSELARVALVVLRLRPPRSGCSRSSSMRSSGSSSRSRRATGAIAKVARSASVFGRPRCQQTRTRLAPFASRSSSVGSEARIRVSSATSPSRNGTLRSARTRTVAPATSASRTERGDGCSSYCGGRHRLADPVDEIDEAAAGSPTRCRTSRRPSRGCRSPSSGRCRRSMSTTSATMSVETSGSSEYWRIPSSLPCRPCRVELVDLLDVSRRPGRRDRRSSPSGPAPASTCRRSSLEVRHHDSDRASRARRRRDEVDRCRAGPPQILVRQVERALVVGVRVDRRHEAALDRVRVVQDLGERRDAVRRARGVGDDLVVLRVVVAVVDADHQRHIGVGRRRRDHDLRGARVEVLLGAVALREVTGDSSATSMPSSPHGRFAGSLSAKNLISSPATRMDRRPTRPAARGCPSTESCLRRCAIVAVSPMSLRRRSRSRPRARGAPGGSSGRSARSR